MNSFILVIKHGALGDIILATGPFKVIRQHHPDARITLLTTRPYADLLTQSPWFDEIWIDAKPKWWQLKKWVALQSQLNSVPFQRVYDLQTSARSSFYLRLFRDPKPEWSGIAEGASHRHDTPHRTRSHTLDREREQLNIAGIAEVPGPDVSWLTGDIDGFSLTPPYALLVPGGSAHRPEKRWPYFSELAQALTKQGLQPVLIGTQAEADLLSTISAACPSALNLCRQTGFGQIAELARHATFAVGNDTGPMHLIAAAGCPSTVLFSSASNPEMCAPRGGHVKVMQSENLSDLSPDLVLSAAVIPVKAGI